MSRAINVVSNQFVITSEDHVVGWAEDSSGNRQAFLWTPTNGMMNLNDVKVGPDNLSAREQGWNLRGAFGVNRKGQIVGRGSHTQDSAEGCTPDGFIWELGADGNAVVRRIGLGDRCDGDNETRGINEFGDVAGILPNPARPNRKAAVKMFDLDYVIDLGSLGGQLGMSYSINNKREVVGHASDSNNLSKAFYWNPEMATTGMVSLGTLGGTGSGARGISDSSQVVGWAYDAKVKGRACLWDLGSKQTYDLNVLSNAGSQWFLEDAQSISSNGRYIIGNSIIKGKRKTYLLTRQF
jgi:probable HAF family extracellular repeat protein